MNVRGLTLVELLVAVVILGVLGSTAVNALRGAERFVRRTSDEAQVRMVWREIRAILSSEFRRLDPQAGDLLAMSPEFVRYRAVRGLTFVCGQSAEGSEILHLESGFLGLRHADPQSDSLLIFADGEPSVTADDRWAIAGMVEVREGRNCPGKAASRDVVLAGASVPPRRAVQTGAPVLIFEVVELLSYRSNLGDWWLGMRRYKPGQSRPTAVQPVAGPLDSQGIVFRFLDSTGEPTRAGEEVAVIEVEVVAAQSENSIPKSNRSQVFAVALRNAG